MESRESLLRAARSRLAEAGLEYAAEDATLLVQRCLGLSRSELLAGGTLTVPPAAAAQVRDWVERYAAGEPLAYLEGMVGFRHLELAVDARVLVPRADSETLVELALEALEAHEGGEGARLLDVGTGSGCLLLALLDEVPGTRGVGLDRSAEALAVATANAQRCGLQARARFLRSDWLSAAADRSADLVLSNPPYVEPGEALGHGVAAYEPALALYAPVGDPLHAYRQLFLQAPRVLGAEGALLVEVGAGRADQVAALGASLGFREQARRRDLGGIERALWFRREPGT